MHEYNSPQVALRNKKPPSGAVVFLDFNTLFDHVSSFLSVSPRNEKIQLAVEKRETKKKIH